MHRAMRTAWEKKVRMVQIGTPKYEHTGASINASSDANGLGKESSYGSNWHAESIP